MSPKATMEIKTSKQQQQQQQQQQKPRNFRLHFITSKLTAFKVITKSYIIT